MFSFLTRMGRLAIGIPIVVAVVTIFGATTLTSVPVASTHPHNNSAGTAACALSGTTVGAALTLTGSGYSADSSYAAEFVWPNGSAGSMPANSNASGTITVSTYAWWAGTYHASVYTTGNHTQLMASCSVTIS